MADAAPARILLVDDEQAQLTALCETLRAQGFEVSGYTNGLEALAALRSEKFDLLLADLTMPGLNGIELLQAARQTDPDLVGLIMTGRGAIDTAVDAMKIGALDYILKPFKLSAILPVVSRALSVRRLRIENAKLTRQLQERTADLEEANKDLEAFSYSVSHDLRTPLRAIDGYCRMIEEDYAGRLDSEGRRLLKAVRDNRALMATLIDDLLDFAKSGRQAIRAREVSMRDLVDEAWASIRAAHPDQNAKLVSGPLPSAWGDASLLRQVWMNLLGNASKYTRKTERPIIEIGAEEGPSHVTFRVADNGVGFDAAQAERLFKPFQRLHSEREFEGTGVGLAIAHRIVSRHGGRIWAEASVGQGATFYFTLPKRTA